MDCPYCHSNDFQVIETRELQRGNATRRRRECKGCGERFTTYERVAVPDLTVQKADGNEEPFDRDKLRAGIEKACEKRPVSEDEIVEIVDDVEGTLRRREKEIVESSEIGDLVIERLKEEDEVAYLRFASVYQSFDDASSFQEAAEVLNRS